MARLASIDEFRSFLNDDGKAPGELLATMLDSAGEQVETYGGRQFAASPVDEAEVETRTVQVGGSRFAHVPDLRPDEDTVVAADGAALTDYRLLARRGHPAHAIVLYQDTDTLTITGRWGFSPTPDSIKLATLQWAAKMWFSRYNRGAERLDNGERITSFGRMPSIVRAAIDQYRIVGL